MGDERKELEYLEKTMEINPEFPLSYFYVARISLNRGERYEEAIALVEKGLELKPEKEQLPLGCFLLADLYNRIGDPRKYQEYLRLGEEARDRIR
ncbi:MAG: hypothetical protein ACE5LV_03135 [Candidatus Aminicenantales bacterium]